jgi:hypothetical protein
VRSPSLSSTATEVSSLTSFYADSIDPRLLDLDASEHDDVLKTPTQLTVGTHFDDRQSNIGNHECDGPPSSSLGSPPQSVIQTPESPAPSYQSDEMYEAVHGLGNLFGQDSGSLFNPLPTTANDVHEAFKPQRLQMGIPFNAHKALREHLTPMTQRPPLAFRDVHGNIASMSTGVRWRISMAKSARLRAEFFESQGNVDAAAAAGMDAILWERKARKRQIKNESQNRIRARKRAKKQAK